MVKAPIPHSFDSQVLVDGIWGGGLSLFDRGLAFGDGLFETLLWVNGRIPLLEFHVLRLANSCVALGIPFDETRVRSYLQSFSQYLSNNASFLCSAEVKTPKALIKLIVTRGVGGQGYIPPVAERTTSSVILFSRAFNDMPLNGSGGVDVLICKTYLGVNTSLAGHKHLSRLEYVLAGHELRNVAVYASGTTCQQGLLLSSEGDVVETLHHNIFWVKGDNICTPLLDRCGVSGVMRGVLIQSVLPKLHMSLHEVRQPLPELLAADEVFICNSVHGITAVTAVGDCLSGVGGKTKALMNALSEEFPEAYGGRY